MIIITLLRRTNNKTPINPPLDLFYFEIITEIDRGRQRERERERERIHDMNKRLIVPGTQSLHVGEEW